MLQVLPCTQSPPVQLAFNVYPGGKGPAAARLRKLQPPQASACAREPAPSFDPRMFLGSYPYAFDDVVGQREDASHAASITR